MIKKIYSKIYTGLFIYLTIIKCRLKKQTDTANNRVFVLSAGGIGDAIVSYQAYMALIEKSILSNNEVYLITNSALQTGLKMVLNNNSAKTHWIICDFLSGKLDHDRLNEFSKQMEELCQLGAKQTIIMSNIRGQFIHSCYIAACLKAKDVKAGLYDQHPKKLITKIRLFAIERLFYKIEKLKEGLNEAIFWRQFINTIDSYDYKIRIPRISRKSSYSIDENVSDDYIVISVDSSTPRRRWPIHNFVKFINLLLEKQDKDIILSGSNLTTAETNEYELAFRGCDRVKNLIGKLKINEWIELIRGGGVCCCCR